MLSIVVGMCWLVYFLFLSRYLDELECVVFCCVVIREPRQISRYAKKTQV